MDPVQALTAFFDAIVSGRLEEVTAMYRPGLTTYVFVEGPRWSTRGYEQVAAGWRAYLNSPIRITHWQWSEGPLSEVWSDSAFIAGLLDLHACIGETSRTVRLRATFVLHRDPANQWRIVHEHVSQPMVDPYGIGDWLEIPNDASSNCPLA